ncbi:alpha/beta hydrolase family protein [Catenovulum sp. SX2]|uniref:alpha/beta hydrolase family protein n=1 Tax=Catenovulum sp. SX2 TaxID=3398614 RepID=UPI003F829DC1
MAFIRFFKRTTFLFVSFICLISAQVFASSNNNIVGVWSGIAAYQHEKTHVTVDIKNSDNGFTALVSLPDIGVSKWPAHKVELDGNNLKILLPADSGMQLIKLTFNESRLHGLWQENRFEEDAKIDLVRTATKPALNEINFSVVGNAGKLSAAIVKPEQTECSPAVILLHGSGAQPKDSNRFIAEQFAMRGVAGVIFDKRGVGESAGNFYQASFDDLADDAISIATYLLQQHYICSVGFWGHSQGGWVAPLAAKKWPNTQFVITSSGPYVSPSTEAEWGFVYPLQSAGFALSAIENTREIVRSWHQSLRTGQSTSFDNLLQKHSKSDWYQVSDLDSLTKVDSQFIDHYLKFMDYDPIPIINSLDVPILSIFAMQDESIDSRESVKILHKLMLTKQNLKIKIYDNYNHAIRALGENSKKLRFPNYPVDYFQVQIDFVKSIINNKLQ